MINELLFFVAVFIDLTFILSSLRFGKSGLTLSLAVNLILVSTFAPKLMAIFGFVSNVGNIYYGSLLLATNLIVEHFGKKEALRAVWLSFAGNILFVTMGQFALRFLGEPQSASVNGAISRLFSLTPRIALASILAYLLVQNFNIWFYSLLKEKSKGKFLWFRHGLSSVATQFFDSLIFFSVAFFSIIPNTALLEAMTIGFILKSLIGLASIPFIYFGNLVKPSQEESHVYQE